MLSGGFRQKVSSLSKELANSVSTQDTPWYLWFTRHSNSHEQLWHHLRVLALFAHAI